MPNIEEKGNDMMTGQMTGVENRDHNFSQPWNGNHSEEYVRTTEVTGITSLRY